MLVLEYGPREAARMVGLNENTVNQWSARGGWLEHIKPAAPKMPKSMQPTRVSGVTRPADALKNAMLEDNNETRASLSRATRKLARKAESADLPDATKVLSVAKTASLLHGWDKQTGAIRISVFAQTVSMDEAMPYAEAIDISDDDDDSQGDPAFT